jgi:hypothetical protein
MWAQDVVSWTVILLYFAAVGGVVLRGRVGVCWTFVLYLGASALADLLMLIWPTTFHQQWFWFGKELVIHVLRFALALELTYRTFRAFPAARSTARGVLLLVLMVTLGIVLFGTGNLEPPGAAPALGPLISRVQPAIVNGAIWLLTAIAGLILWYRLPVHAFHKAILVGLVPYLLVYTVVLGLIESHGWGIRTQVNYLLTVAYLLVLGYWAVAAWRSSESPARAQPLVPDPSPGRTAG